MKTKTSEVLQSIYAKGDLSDDGFDVLMREADKSELVTAAISLSPKDPRGHALIQRSKELRHRK